MRLLKPDGQGGWLPGDDQLEIQWDDSAFTWPFASPFTPAGVPAATQAVPMSGSFSLESIFIGADTSGYGELGATETVIGAGIAMQAAPFAISDFAAACPDGPELQADPNAKVQITSAGSRYGVMNLFSQEVRGTLSLRMTFASSRADDCGLTPGLTAVVDNSSAPAIPVRFNGKFAISPAITADGKVRFGVITIDDTVTPQLSTFGFVRSCTQQPATSPCDPQQFPARFKFKKLTADVLLGGVVA